VLRGRGDVGYGWVKGGLLSAVILQECNMQVVGWVFMVVFSIVTKRREPAFRERSLGVMVPDWSWARDTEGLGGCNLNGIE
jgi:hypothetical protein